MVELGKEMLNQHLTLGGGGGLKSKETGLPSTDDCGANKREKRKAGIVGSLGPPLDGF